MQVPPTLPLAAAAVVTCQFQVGFKAWWAAVIASEGGANKALIRVDVVFLHQLLQTAPQQQPCLFAALSNPVAVGPEGCYLLHAHQKPKRPQANKLARNTLETHGCPQPHGDFL
jgi:hypothetical protein